MKNHRSWTPRVLLVSCVLAFTGCDESSVDPETDGGLSADASSPVDATEPSRDDASARDAHVGAPAIAFVTPDDAAVVEVLPLEVRAALSPGGATATLRLELDGDVVAEASDADEIAASLETLTAGSHTLRAIATHADGHESTDEITIERADADGPVLEITSPRDGVAIAARRVRLTGTATDDVAVTALEYAVSGGDAIAVELAADGSYDFELVPAPGANEIVLTARDAAGHERTAMVSVHYGHRISGGNSQAAMLNGGALYTWGRNELGQLGNGTLVSTADDDDPAGMYSHDGLTGLVSIVTRQTFMLALHEDGRVFAWGSNSDGQLGYATPSDCGSGGTSPCARTPGAVLGISGAVAIAAGFDHSLVLLADGTALSFGANEKGQLGDGTTITRSAPTAITGLTDLVQLAAGSTHTLALTRGGEVYAWGNDQYGQRGSGTADTDAHPTPALVPSLTGIVAIAAANHSSYALRSDGTVVAWGQNNNGQLGNGTSGSAAHVTSPTEVLIQAAADGVPAVALTGVESIAADGFVALAVTTDGRLFSWGMGALGQLGMGITATGDRDLANRTVATEVVVPVADRPDFVVLETEVGSGGGAYALTTRGATYGWGWSFRGSLIRPELIHAWAYTSPFAIWLP